MKALPESVPAQPLRVLSLWQPWASLMAFEEKRWETRSWETSYRGLVAIHAAKVCNAQIRELIETRLFWTVLRKHLPDGELSAVLPFGKVVAIGRLAMVYDAQEVAAVVAEHPGCAGYYESAFGDYSGGRFGWRFAQVQSLPKPILFRGSQGLFNAPRALREAIAEQLPTMKEVLR